MAEGKRGPGRPRKTEAAPAAKRGRGRPKGSRNRSAAYSKILDGLKAKSDARKASAAAERAKKREAKGLAPAKKRGRKPGSTAKVLRRKRVAPKVAKHGALFGEAGKVVGKRLKSTGAKRSGAGRPRKSNSHNPKAAGHAKAFDDVVKAKRAAPGHVVPAKLKRGPKPGSKNRRFPHNTVFNIPSAAKSATTATKRKGRGPDKAPRKRRTKAELGKAYKNPKKGVNGGLGMVGNMAAKVGMPTKAKLSNKGGLHVQQPTKRAVKMVVHRTPTTKIGDVVAKKGKLKIG